MPFIEVKIVPESPVATKMPVAIGDIVEVDLVGRVSANPSNTITRCQDGSGHVHVTASHCHDEALAESDAANKSANTQLCFAPPTSVFRSQNSTTRTHPHNDSVRAGEFLDSAVLSRRFSPLARFRGTRAQAYRSGQQARHNRYLEGKKGIHGKSCAPAGAGAQVRFRDQFVAR